MNALRCGAAACLWAALLGRAAAAQDSGSTPLPAIGSDLEDRSRLAQLLGQSSGASFLLRSASEGLDTLPATGDTRFRLLAPAIVAVSNSSLPFSLNEGAMWAARGWSEDVRLGFRARVGRVSLVVAPELVATENLWYPMPPFQVELPLPPGRSPYADPWHVGQYSIDLPLRFGQRGVARLDPGQSTLAVDLGAVTVGLSSENEWWGPGIRNAIVLSNNAPGIPRLFVRTTRPLTTRIGTFSARWFLGELTESPYFDSDPANNHRAITAFAGTWVPAGAPDLTVGFARVVYAPLEGGPGLLGHVFDVLRDQGMHTVPGDSVARPSRDQIVSLFARWIFPADGLAVHVEYARQQWPASLRELLTDPNHSQGYTLGLEWARPLPRGLGALRLQAELTYLEKPPSYRNTPEQTWYTSAASPQGYTQQGRVIGAAIGPGASNQWLAVDYFRPKWRLGVFGGRIRWDDDALYMFPAVYANSKFCSHDVTLFGGITGALDSRWGAFESSVTFGERLNVFFYHLSWCGPTADQLSIVDARNTTLRLSFTPRLP